MVLLRNGGRARDGSLVEVFVASTYEDLVSYRAAATRSILTSGNISDDMLFWPAEESPPLDISIRRVRSCDLLILLLAHRYGKPPDGHDVSITELEFDEAVARQIPVLAFSVDPTYPWPPHYVETDPAARARLGAFTKKVSNRVTHKRFTSPESLEVAVTHALTGFIAHQARYTALPRYVKSRARRVSRPDSLHYSADSLVQVGHAPDTALLLLSVTRHIRVDDDLAKVAAGLGKDLSDPAFKEILAQLSQEARNFSATTGICESAANGNSGKFYVPHDPITHQAAPSLFQSMLGYRPGTAADRNTLHLSPAAGRPVFGSGSPLAQISATSFRPGGSNASGDLGAPSLDEPSFKIRKSPRASDASKSQQAEPKVTSVGGLNRFLCIALDSAPTAWSGGWAVYSSGERKFVIGRPFIEEGLEGLPDVRYTISGGTGQHSKDVLVSGDPGLFIQEWTRILSSADDAELQQLSHKITIPRSSIALFTLEVIDEVARLHETGRIHGDIKPSNILVSRTDTLLIDDADLKIGDISPTVTPGWSPSEQLLRKPLTVAADIFPLGQLLLHVLGAEPLGREVRYRMPGGQIALIFDNPEVYVGSSRPYAPTKTREGWCRLVERALRTEPGERWPTARQMAEEMRALLEEEDLEGGVEIRLPWGERPALVLDDGGHPTAGWIIQTGNEKTLLSDQIG
jgi:hypothetical protein